MPNPAETLYTFRRPYTAVYVRGRANTTTLPVYRSGALVAPSSGTYTLADAGDTSIVSAAAVTITGSVATYALTAVHLPSTATLSANYLETWVLVLPDGTTRTWSEEVVVARRHLYPVVTDDDLAEVRANFAALLPQGVTTAQTKIDAAWKTIIGKLIESGRWPHAVMNSQSLRTAHVSLALSLLYSDAASRQGQNSVHKEQADEFRTAFESAWKDVRLALDNDGDGRTDDPDTRFAAGTAVHVNAAPSGWSGRAVSAEFG